MIFRSRFFVLAVAFVVLSPPATAGEPSQIAELLAGGLETVRINLNNRGASLGFESEFDGDDPRLANLIAVIRSADRGGGHKCPNVGAIRLRMAVGGVIGLGLLPSHSPGLYGFRLYNNDVFLGAYIVPRSPLLSVLEELGVPMDDPAFQQ